MKFTVMGGSGFIGSHLVRHLRERGHEVSAPERGATPEPRAGHVVYSVGLTGDFRSRLHETVEAHVTQLSRDLRQISFDSFLYLSSTRVYGGLPTGTTATEDSKIPVRPSADSVYDLSKLLGEALCLGTDNPAVRVARLSNVYGPGQSAATFLGAVLRQFAEAGKVLIGEAPQSAKDYIGVEETSRLLASIATRGNERLYNVASGTRTSHHDIARAITLATGGNVEFAADAPLRVFPEIAVSRIMSEFGHQAKSLLDEMPNLIASLYSKQAVSWQKILKTR